MGGFRLAYDLNLASLCEGLPPTQCARITPVGASLEPRVMRARIAF